MSTPQPAFSPWEHLQNVLIRIHNQRVRQYFRANDDDLGDIATPAGSVLRACLIVDDDSQLQVLNRQLFFWFQVGAAKDLLDPIIGTNLSDYKAGKAYKPTITLFFEQDADSVPDGFQPLKAQVSFGIPNETHTSLTEANLRTIARAIKLEFGAGNGYRWSKGKILCTYKDEAGDFNNLIYALNESEANQLIRKVCDVVNVPYNDDYFTVHIPKKSNTAPAETITVLGRPRRKRRYRPAGTVRFRYASVAVYPIPVPIILVSYPWRHPNALEFLSI